MIFVLHEIKLWLTDGEERILRFLPNKVNVITGDATTGKTSIWNIVDYCLLADRVNVANTINKSVDWFGISFSINDRQKIIVRRSPVKNSVSSDVCYYENSDFPTEIQANISIPELKSILDIDFGITDNLRFPFNGQYGKVDFNLSYRHFLLFNALTENIIGTQNTYFDTSFFGKDEYDKVLPVIFDMVIGINDVDIITAKKQIEKIEKEIRKIKRNQEKKESDDLQYKNKVKALWDKCVLLGVIENNDEDLSIDEMILQMQSVIENYTAVSQNNALFDECEKLIEQRNYLNTQINALKRYKKEYNSYNKTLAKVADSMKPIEFLRDKVSDEILITPETHSFIRMLEDSLANIKGNNIKEPQKYVEVDDDIKKIQIQIKGINDKIYEFEKSKIDVKRQYNRLIAVGEIKNELFRISQRKFINPIDSTALNKLIDEKKDLENNQKENEQVKYALKKGLDEEIQNVYEQVTTMPSFKGYKTLFDTTKMNLTLQRPDEFFPIENLGSKSNFMFMHLCFYLGLHSHMNKVGQIHVPQLLFIDQPSIPYYSGSNNNMGNNDKSKLLNAFEIINDFVTSMIKNKFDFQIIMTEHAPKSYWEDNSLYNFYTVDEFINGNGLVPKDSFQNE